MYIYPIISALLYTLIVPLLSWKFETILKQVNIKRNEIKLDIKSKKLNKKLELAETQRQIEEKISGTNEISQLRNSNKTLNSELTELKEKLANMSEKDSNGIFRNEVELEKDETPQALRDLQESGLLEDFVKIANYIQIETDTPYSTSPKDKVEKEKVLVLESLGLLEKSYENEFDVFTGDYVLTTKGESLYKHILLMKYKK
jgi:hypothetical protein